MYLNTLGTGVPPRKIREVLAGDWPLSLPNTEATEAERSFPLLSFWDWSPGVGEGEEDVDEIDEDESLRDLGVGVFVRGGLFAEEAREEKFTSGPVNSPDTVKGLNGSVKFWWGEGAGEVYDEVSPEGREERERGVTSESSISGILGLTGVGEVRFCCCCCWL